MLQGEYEQLSAEYVRLVKEHFGSRLHSICFFGSVPRGEASPESDTDALVIADGLPSDIGLRFQETGPIHEAIRTTEAYKTLTAHNRCGLISDIFLTPAETRAHPPILLDIADHGVVAYDREGFLEGELKKIRARLHDLGARKVDTKNGYYWILKPDAKPTEVVEI